MRGITFAVPDLLWLLLLVPAMIAFYLWRQRDSHATLKMPGMDPFRG